MWLSQAVDLWHPATPKPAMFPAKPFAPCSNVSQLLGGSNLRLHLCIILFIRFWDIHKKFFSTNYNTEKFVEKLSSATVGNERTRGLLTGKWPSRCLLPLETLPSAMSPRAECLGSLSRRDCRPQLHSWAFPPPQIKAASMWEKGGFRRNSGYLPVVEKKYTERMFPPLSYWSVRIWWFKWFQEVRYMTSIRAATCFSLDSSAWLHSAASPRQVGFVTVSLPLGTSYFGAKKFCQEILLQS